MIVIKAYKAAVERLGLVSIDAVKYYSGELVKNQRGRRDILRIVTQDVDGAPLTFFLKRIFRPYKKDGLKSLLRRGKVWSAARQEWHNMQLLNRYGFPTAELVAWGEEVGPFWERFSFILTRAAPGRTVDEYLRNRPGLLERRRVLASLARHVRALHDQGMGSPDLFARHFFFEWIAGMPHFYLIDMARLHRKKQLGLERRARDLAALHVSMPLKYVPTAERMMFLREYGEGSIDRPLVQAIENRAERLLRRAKFADFARA